MPEQLAHVHRDRGSRAASAGHEPTAAGEGVQRLVPRTLADRIDDDIDSPAAGAIADLPSHVNGRVVEHPQTGERTTLANLIITWHPERKERILLAAHYDTRPFPDRDEKNPRGLFVGANDGASGVAVLCELGRQMPKLESRYGVDFVLFDGEELIYTDRDDYFLGSKHFAKEYVANPQGHRYTQGALLDMVGDASLQIYYEQNSITWANTRPVVQSIWKTARRLGVSEFIPRIGHLVRDDHLAIHDDAGIPMCDIIDFDYPHPAAKRSYWHTTDDVPANCSALSLAKVGWVVSEWLKGVK